MKIFDLHCDTASVLYHKKLPFDNPLTHINRNNIAPHRLTQCFAVFFDDSRPDPLGLSYFNGVINEVFPQLNQPGITPLLTVEGVGVLAEEPGWLNLLSACNCRMAGLVWNGKNPLATGAATDDRAKLSPMGREAVLSLISRRIIIDVSHLSSAGTEEILTLTEDPIAASHSNARAVHDHFRNLSDSFAKEIFRRGGIVGLNLYPDFLAEKDACMDDVLRHAEHFLSLGGERGLALGCDFDGVDRLPRGMTDFTSLQGLYSRFVSEFGEATANNIFYNNAEQFFSQTQEANTVNRKEVPGDGSLYDGRPASFFFYG